ncbi:MAG: hypothetical protein HOW73_41390 [Polyangiaceae bacterium]|nr:hypothetical protein [Polyangiaceae bacterium]
MFTLLKEETDQLLYRYSSLLVNIHWDELRLEQLASIATACEYVVAREGRLTSIIVMRGNVNIDLSAEARRAGASLTTRFEQYNTGQALVIESDGFRASLARSVITGIHLVARSRASQRVFQDPREATKWLCSLPKQPPEIASGFESIWPAFEKLLKERRRTAQSSTVAP